MASETSGINKTYTLNESGGVVAGQAANLDSTRGQVVKGTANSEHFAGVFEAAVTNGKPASMAKSGLKKVRIGAAVTIRKYATVDANGNFINLPVNATPVSYYVVGKFEETGAALGNLVDMHIICPPIVISS